MATVRSGPAEIYYELHGPRSSTAPALVFAHGRGGNAASWWQQVPFFAERYRVVVFDHRCFGRSRCPPEHFDREHFDLDLIAVLDAASIERAAIVCQSMGGWTGLRTAVGHPERVWCLVLSNTPAGVDAPRAHAALARARERFAEVGVASAALARDFPSRHPEAAYLYAHIGSLNTALPPDLGAGGDAAVTAEQLAGFAVPTLLVTSQHDDLIPPEVVEEVAKLIPGAEVERLSRAGHSPYFETPGAFNRLVAGFLARHR